MKLIRQTRLTLQQGNSDQIFEVDLCEQAKLSHQRYLVNIRYGRRGNRLTESSKTTYPVTLEEATKIFHSIVVSKCNQGYMNPAEETEEREIIEQPADHAISTKTTPNAFDLNDALLRIQTESVATQRARMIWRLPQQQNPQLAQWLAERLCVDGDYFEQYSILWTLGRVGDANQLAAAQQFLHCNSPQLCDLALEVVCALSPEETQRLQPNILSALPPVMAQAIQQQNATDLTQQFQQEIQATRPQANEILQQLYRLALTQPIVHRCLLEQLRMLPLVPNLFKGFRHLCKMAEFRLDAPLFALLVWRIETTPYFFRKTYWDNYYLPGSGYLSIESELKKPNARLAYSHITRDYFRRRSWRTLRRLGTQQDPRYVDLAQAILLQFSEQDQHTKREGQSTRWQFVDGRYQPITTTTHHYDGYASYLALHAILHSRSERVTRNKNGLAWALTSHAPLTQREEAFPALWDQRPDALLQLLMAGQIEMVCAFAARALQDQTVFCATISEEQLIQLLQSPFAITLNFCLRLLESRELSTPILLALLQSRFAQAHTLALTKLVHRADLYQQRDIMQALLLLEDDAVHQWLMQRFQREAFRASDSEVLLEALLHHLQQDTALSLTQADRLVQLLQLAMADAIQQLSLTTITALLAQADEGIQLFAAHLLRLHPVRYQDIPPHALTALYQSNQPQLRALGLSLLSKLQSTELLQQLPMLVDLIYHGEEAERSSCFQLLQKLLPLHGEEIFRQLLPLVFREEVQAGQQAQLMNFIHQQLSHWRDQLDKDTIWRLLQARAVTAQQLGAAALTHVSATRFSVKQWAVMADHPFLQVREYAQQAFLQQIPLVKQQMQGALRLLETRWSEMQEFGFHYFRKHFQAADWSPERIIYLCDSNLDAVQRFGRELLQTFFIAEQGEEYLLKLSQHPSSQVQLFASSFLHDYAAGQPQLILTLQPYFLTVLSRVNKGRVAKDRVLNFLLQQANSSPQVLEMVAALFSRLSLTLVDKDKSQLIKAMLQLLQQHPQLPLPLQYKTLS